ncbi:MAG: hypothetical protein ACYDBJ_29040 [Aggregatilineales bacterium]
MGWAIDLGLLEQNPGVNHTTLGYTGAPTDSSGLVYLNARFGVPSGYGAK